MPPMPKDNVTENTDVPQPAGAEPDLPPECCRYRDDGCEFASSCLSCPFARCLYDEPGGRQHFTKGLRDKEILRLFSVEKQGVAELAAVFAISQRTVQRALKRAGDDD